jgi:hypothetical protein
MKTLPKVGDKVTIWRSRPRPDGERVHPSWAYSGNCNARWKKPDGTYDVCYCRGATEERYDDEMVIEEIMWFADNSIEAHGYAVSDGHKWHTMLDAPHGDACF